VRHRLMVATRALSSGSTIFLQLLPHFGGCQAAVRDEDHHQVLQEMMLHQ